MAISKAIAIFDVVACLPIPVAHFAVVLAPCVNGTIANSNLSSAASFALKIGGFVYVVVDAMSDTSYSISGGEAV